MTLLRKQSGTGCSVSGEGYGEAKPYNYRDDPFYQYLARTVRRGRRFLDRESRSRRRQLRIAKDPDFLDHERTRRYGITLEQLRAMYARQNHACAICGRTGCELVVDHDHVTGELRGLLCIPCNLILGLLRDDPRIARAAAEYLEGARIGAPPVQETIAAAMEVETERKACSQNTPLPQPVPPSPCTLVPRPPPPRKPGPTGR
jgi:hypothetical protein